MVKAKETMEDHIGWHLFTVDGERCSIYYRGTVAKETDKTFLLPERYGKVLKTNHWLLMPKEAEPAKVLAAFEAAKNEHQKDVIDRELALATAKGRRFKAVMEALNSFSPVAKDTETSTVAG